MGYSKQVVSTSSNRVLNSEVSKAQSKLAIAMIAPPNQHRTVEGPGFAWAFDIRGGGKI